MALGCEMDNAVDVVFTDYAAHLVEVGDVRLHESVVRLVLDVLEVGEVAGICQLVEVDDMIVGIFVYKEPHNVRADESGSAGNQYVTLHFFNLKR